MEPKKNPKHDVHRKRGIIFNMSLVVSLVVVISAFKWVVPIQEQYKRVAGKILPDEVVYVPITDYATPDKSPKPKIVSQLIVNPNLIEVKNDLPVDEPENAIDQNDLIEPIAFGNVELPVERKTDSIFVIVEKMPEPIDGYGKFYKTLGQNLKYPPRANRLGTHGKVFVQFTVNENGALTDLKVIKGIGDGCDEEAIRVISLTKWNAGKQRGIPVKVRMIQPVVFALTR